MKEKQGASDAPALLDDSPQVVKADLRKFSKAEAKVNTQIAALKEITVTDQPTADLAMSILKNANEVAKLIEKKRVELVTPFNDAVKKINDYAKRTLLKNLEDEIIKAKQVVIDWQKKERDRVMSARIEQLEQMGFKMSAGAYYHSKHNSIRCFNSEIRDADEKVWNSIVQQLVERIAFLNGEKAKELQSQLQDVEDFGTEEQAGELKNLLDNFENPVAVPSTNYTTAGSVKGITKRWTFSILNSDEVPREYLTVDETKVRKAIAEGIREIAGVRIFQEEGLSIR